MLRNTFLHIQGVGASTERKIWGKGLHNWAEFLSAHASGQLAGRTLAGIVPDVEESVRRYDAGDWNFFDQALPSNHKWRAFGDFSGRALYVDIETTGYGGDDQITVIGVYNGRETKSFVWGRDLEKAVDEIEGYPLIVTFNGMLFDMPIIRERFRYNLFNHIHVDLRFPLRALGYSGGLKKIEQVMGIERTARTTGMSGWDAVRLWHEYQHGSQESLDVLLEYNREDIVNLEPLMRFVFEQMTSKTAGM
ncbi:MAG TPA: exonuclease [Verrucomicrobia bacterium]|nr:MAG: hypothetical protein A2X46_18045 [Lentisphaerae bacterium GWF2_57_35]HBA85363.1 exonuclease [Verrucomicrobiota bacterium]